MADAGAHLCLFNVQGLLQLACPRICCGPNLLDGSRQELCVSEVSMGGTAHKQSI